MRVSLAISFEALHLGTVVQTAPTCQQEVDESIGEGLRVHLLRQIEIPVEVDFVAAASYGSSAESSGTIKVRLEPTLDVTGRHVLVIEDIIDTGLTLSKLQTHMLHGKQRHEGSGSRPRTGAMAGQRA